jgi:2-polyprenyl-3-methyl-5-hydroxy-6-metoxy-1,4-benzoquinol methylase
MSWDEMASTWNDDPMVQAYSRAAFGSLERALAERGRSLHGARVLDFGCGTGLLTEHIAAHADHVVGLDISGPMVQVLDAKRIPNVRAVAADLLHALGTDPLQRDSFQLITCSSVLAFVPDHPATVAALATLLAPGGLLIHWDWTLNPTDEEPYGLTTDAALQALTDAGLEHATVDVGFELPVEGGVMAPLRGIGQRAR